MTPAQQFNLDQQARWNGSDGDYWTRNQDSLDRMLAPVIGRLLEFADAGMGSTVLDVGCGCGATSVEFARAVGPPGKIFAADISEPMLRLAQERLRPFPNATCLLGDVATLPLDGIAADLIVSRFGVMFFGDPVAAFANLRSALVPGGRVRFACWRALIENPWMLIPLQAAYQDVPPLPKPGPEDPGPFAFADTDRVTRILTAAGFTAPSFTQLDIPMDIASGGTLDEAVARATDMGATKAALKDQPEELCAAARKSIRKALEPYESSNGVTLPGAVWLVAAEKL